MRGQHTDRCGDISLSFAQILIIGLWKYTVHRSASLYSTCIIVNCKIDKCASSFQASAASISCNAFVICGHFWTISTFKCSTPKGRILSSPPPCRYWTQSVKWSHTSDWLLRIGCPWEIPSVSGWPVVQERSHVHRRSFVSLHSFHSRHLPEGAAGYNYFSACVWRQVENKKTWLIQAFYSNFNICKVRWCLLKLFCLLHLILASKLYVVKFILMCRLEHFDDDSLCTDASSSYRGCAPFLEC